MILGVIKGQHIHSRRLGLQRLKGAEKVSYDR
jgi:hypothetical protein